ncbi:hypothetical protein Pcinc_026369, partial [Petrolisthes cinctipes]
EQVTSRELQERALKLTFYDVDRDKKHQVIGHVLFILKDLWPWEGRRLVRGDLEREVRLSPRELGQVEVSLCYNDNLERLTVTVAHTRHLKVDKEVRQDVNEFQTRVSLMQQARVDKVVGRVQLGSFMFARGKALEHWNLMLTKKREHTCSPSFSRHSTTYKHQLHFDLDQQ